MSEDRVVLDTLTHLCSQEDACGVDTELQRFLTLIRDSHKLADKATYFIESRAGVSNIYGIANLRDVMSHLAAFLEKDATLAERKEHLVKAEEHTRRAILEAYETAIAELGIKFQYLYDSYKKRLLPVMGFRQ